MKKAYDAPALTVHGSVEALTQFYGGSNTEFLAGNPITTPGPIGNCTGEWGNTDIYGCSDLGS
jgi:hypothetical protein